MANPLPLWQACDLSLRFKTMVRIGGLSVVAASCVASFLFGPERTTVASKHRGRVSGRVSGNGGRAWPGCLRLRKPAPGARFRARNIDSHPTPSRERRYCRRHIGRPAPDLCKSPSLGIGGVSSRKFHGRSTKCGVPRLMGVPASRLFAGGLPRRWARNCLREYPRTTNGRGTIGWI